jgi:hypothetical protein
MDCAGIERTSTTTFMAPSDSPGILDAKFCAALCRVEPELAICRIFIPKHRLRTWKCA